MKLVVSDLDGTILKRGEKELNRNILSAIEYILSNNVAFAVSSGRTYVELKKFFAPFENDIYFMANDGAQTIYKEETPPFLRPRRKNAGKHVKMQEKIYV